MEEYTEEQALYIQQLAKADELYNNILAKDPKGMIIHGKEREELRKLKEKSKKVLDKLRSREFSVAIVGLEKAGKSTVANAILKLPVSPLPEDSERCTFTTTEIRAGEKNCAEVYFYSRNEFNQNFKNMLETVGYDHDASLETLDKNTFVSFWDRIAHSEDENEQRLYREQDNTTAADIRAMLDGKDILEDMLNHGPEPEIFDVDQLTKPEFKKYVTGYKSDERNDEGVRIVAREAYPYGVKKVVIYSKDLQDMSNIVLYDVPGFDSPTKLHKKQTENQLKEADAIILVTKVTTPSLTGPQLDMLNKVFDSDGVCLNEKAFIFGNQLDKCDNQEMAKGNKNKLHREVVDNKLAKGNRIICGSARASLESAHIKPNDSRIGTTGAPEKLASWGMTDGITDLRDGLKEYYNHDRFEVLKKRANKSLSETRDYLESILGQFTPGKLDSLDLGHRDIQELGHCLGDFKQEAAKKRDEIVAKIWEETPFSKRLEDKIEEIFPEQDENNPTLQKIYLSGDVDGTQKITKIDTDIRNELQTKFSENIVKEMAEATVQYEDNFRNDLIQLFLTTMGMPENSPYKAELTESVAKLFDNVLVKGGEHCRFNSLVERFITAPIEVLIGHPYGSEERYNKFVENSSSKSTLNEFLSLAVYYQDNDDLMTDDRVVKELSIFSRTLLHQDSQKQLYEENTNEFKDFSKNFIKDALNIAGDLIPASKVVKPLLKAGLRLKDNAANLEEALGTVRYNTSNWDTLKKEEQEQLLDKGIESFANKNSVNANLKIQDVLAKMQDRARNEIKLDSSEKIFEFLNQDIEILQDITKNSVRYAMGLERAFVSTIQKNVDIICKSITDKDTRSYYDEWIDDNVWKLRPDKRAAIYQSVEDNAARKEITAAIRQLLDQA